MSGMTIQGSNGTVMTVNSVTPEPQMLQVPPPVVVATVTQVSQNPAQSSGVVLWGTIDGNILEQLDLQEQFALKAGIAELNAHIADHNNPHQVTKDQVGLPDVDNTPDANKPLSGPQATAMAAAITAATTGLQITASQISNATAEGRNIITGATAAGRAIANAASAPAQRTLLGSGAIGDTLFQATTAAGARGNIGAGATGDSLFTASTAAIARNTLNVAPMPVGQLRVRFNGANNIEIYPYQGNYVMCNGLYYQVPSGGIAIAPTGVATLTRYYLYVYWNGSALAGEYSTTGHTTDPNNGQETKIGDVTRTLVGMVYTTGAGVWPTGSPHLLINWFNQRPRAVRYPQPADYGVYSPTYSEIGAGAYRMLFCCWPGEIGLTYAGTAFNNVAGTLWYTAAGVNGTPTPFPLQLTGDLNALIYRSFNFYIPITMIEGNHFAAAYSQDNAVATTTYFTGNTLVVDFSG